MDSWPSESAIEIEPHPKLRPFIRNYAYEKSCLYINFFESPHYHTCDWIEEFFNETINDIEFDCFFFVYFWPEISYSFYPGTTALDQIPAIAKHTGLANIPCFSLQLSEEVKEFHDAFQTDAFKIAAIIHKEKHNY